MTTARVGDGTDTVTVTVRAGRRWACAIGEGAVGTLTMAEAVASPVVAVSTGDRVP